MNVLTFSSLWPNPMQPLHGVFVRERIKALSQLCSVKVVAPVPWSVPIQWLGAHYYRYTQVPHYEKSNFLEVFHPRFIVLPKIMKWSDGWLMFASLFRKIKDLRQAFRFDLIDAHWAYPDGYAAGRIARQLGVPYIVTVRGSDVAVFAQEKHRRILIRKTLMGAQRVICVAKSLQELVVDLGIPKGKTVVIENGIDPQKFHRIPRKEARERLFLSQDMRIILGVGHLCELKGFHLLIDAAKRLQVENVADSRVLRLLIVGEDAAWEGYRDRLVQQIAQHNLQDLVELAGPKPPEELKYWYAAADTFCLASSREGCPNVVLESLACGTPVVATAIDGISDILSSPSLGILVERNVSSIRQGIAEALGRAWDHQHIAEYARRQYSWDKAAAKVHAVFEETVASG